MAIIPVNLNGVAPAGTYEAYNPGLYTLQITETRIEVAKSSGEPKLTVIFTIIDGPDGSQENTGRKLPRSYPLNKGQAFLKRLQLACRIDDQTLAQQGGQLSEEMLMNAIIRAQVTVRAYNGRQTNDVTELVPEAPAAATYAAPQGFAQPMAPQGFAQPVQPTAPVAMPGTFTPQPAFAVPTPAQPFVPPQAPAGFVPPQQPAGFGAPQPQFPVPGGNGQAPQFPAPQFPAPAAPGRR